MAEQIGAALERNAELPLGTELVARYKGAEYSARVVKGDAGEPVTSRRVLVENKAYRSLSEAAKAVCGGTSVNGWRFWRLAPQSATPAAPAKRGRGRPRKVQTPVGGDDGATCAGSAGVRLGVSFSTTLNGVEVTPDEYFAAMQRKPERRTLEESLSSAPGGSDEQVDRLFCESCGAEVSNYAEALEHAADAGHPWDAARARCLYCGRLLPETQRYYDNEPVAPVDDDDFWRLVASQHDSDCEWVQTRAHRASASPASE